VGKSVLVLAAVERFLVWLVVVLEQLFVVGIQQVLVDQVELHSWLVVLVCSTQGQVVVLQWVLQWRRLVGRALVWFVVQPLRRPVELGLVWFVAQPWQRPVELELESLVAVLELVLGSARLVAVCELLNRLMGQRMQRCQHWAGFVGLLFVVVVRFVELQFVEVQLNQLWAVQLRVQL
jgi:hypothetical protein